MARTPQTQAKRARELALKERRERKQAKKAEAAARRAAGGTSPAAEHEGGVQGADDQAETAIVPERAQ